MKWKWDWWRRKKINLGASSAPSSSILPGPPSQLFDPAAIIRSAFEEHGGTVGMRGYAPIVTVSENRQWCEGCRKRVYANIRHICIYNAEYHLDTLTPVERIQLIEDLKALGIRSHPLLESHLYDLCLQGLVPRRMT